MHIRKIRMYARKVRMDARSVRMCACRSRLGGRGGCVCCGKRARYDTWLVANGRSALEPRCRRGAAGESESGEPHAFRRRRRTAGDRVRPGLREARRREPLVRRRSGEVSGGRFPTAFSLWRSRTGSGSWRLCTSIAGRVTGSGGLLGGEHRWLFACGHRPQNRYYSSALGCSGETSFLKASIFRSPTKSSSCLR